MNNRKLILYIATSIDGYIATPDGNLDWLSIVASPGEDYGYHEFTQTIDTVIMGRKTYDKVLTFGIPYPHADKMSYIITGTPRPAEGNIEFYTGDLTELITNLKSRPGNNIFCDGGAQLVNELMKQDLIDEYIISVIPVFLGGGIKLFNDGRPQTKMNFLAAKTFSSGLVQLHYTFRT